MSTKRVVSVPTVGAVAVVASVVVVVSCVGVFVGLVVVVITCLDFLAWFVGHKLLGKSGLVSWPQLAWYFILNFRARNLLGMLN